MADESPLTYALIQDNPQIEIVELLVKSGLFDYNQRGADGATVFANVVYYLSDNPNVIPLLKYMLDNGADVNVIDGGGNSPLHYLNYKMMYTALTSADKIEQYKKIAKFLLDNGADINIQNKYGSTVANISSTRNDPIYKFWLSVGAKQEEYF